MSKVYGQVRPMVGSTPVAGTEAMLVEVNFKNDARTVADITYLSGPTVWMKTDGLPLWTGVGLFDLRGKLLYRYSENQRLVNGDTVTAII